MIVGETLDEPVTEMGDFGVESLPVVVEEKAEGRQLAEALFTQADVY